MRGAGGEIELALSVEVHVPVGNRSDDEGWE